jgi:nucleoside transporter
MKNKNYTLMSTMMFLQLFVWGTWFTTLGLALSANGMSDIIGNAYAAVPLAAIIAPLSVGLIADRFLNCEKTMGILHIIGGALLLMAPSLIASGDSKTLSLVILGHMLCYMPTLALSNTVAFSNITNQDDFPKLRVWGTIGWIAAGLLVGGMGLSSSPKIFTIGAVSAFALGALSFALPKTPPPSKGKPLTLSSILMFDAFKLLDNKQFLVFMVSSALVCIPLAYYYAFTSVYLPQIGFQATASTMSLGQFSEIFFMLLIPLMYRKLGVRYMILIGMAAWGIRYLLFAFAAPDQVIWMVLSGVLLHGVCYDFFFVTGFMYTDNKAPREIRSQAQSLLVFFTQGLGMYFGYKVAGAKFGALAASSDSLSKAIGDPPKFGFWESFGKMFVAVKSEVDPSILETAMTHWKDFWMYPAYLSFAIAIFFAIEFWDKGKEKE